MSRPEQGEESWAVRPVLIDADLYKLGGLCPQRNCGYNDAGVCALWDPLGAAEFGGQCDDALIDPERCPDCGETLARHTDWEPYGNTFVPRTTWYCPAC